MNFGLGSDLKGHGSDPASALQTPAPLLNQVASSVAKYVAMQDAALICFVGWDLCRCKERKQLVVVSLQSADVSETVSLSGLSGEEDAHFSTFAHLADSEVCTFDDLRELRMLWAAACDRTTVASTEAASDVSKRMSHCLAA